MNQSVRDTIETGLNRFSQRHFGKEISNLKLLTGGANMELWAFDCGEQPLILRRYRGGKRPDFGDNNITLEAEATILTQINKSDIKAPKVMGQLEAGDGLGSGYIMERVNGEALPYRLFKDPAYTKALDTLLEEFGATLVKIHRSDTSELSDVIHSFSAADKLRQIERVFSTIKLNNPVIAAAFEWLKYNMPQSTDRLCLVHGDFRMGNLLVDTDGLSSVLDWELAHIGLPESDLAWLCMPSWRFGRYELTAGGVGMAEDLISAYEKNGGTVDRAVFQWFLIWSCLSWGASTVLMTNLWRDGQDKSLERLVVGTRISEVETDLMLLLEEALSIGQVPTIKFEIPKHNEANGDIRPDELSGAVADFILSEIVPAAQGAHKFHTRVAANALSISARINALKPRFQTAQKARLEKLGFTDQSLFDSILSGETDWKTPEIIQHMRLLCLERLAMHQPKYAGGKRARQKWIGEKNV